MTDEQQIEEEKMTYCAVHPDRETGLQCNKCGRYMCAQCAVQTPVGYRCRECVRQVEDKFYSATQRDYAVLFAVAFGLGAVAGAIISFVSWLLLAFILAFPVGGGIAEVALRVIQRRRGRQTAQVLAAGTAIGAAVGAGIRFALNYENEWGEVVRLFENAGQPLPPQVPNLTDYVVNNLTDIGLLAFIVLAALAAYSRVKM